MNFLARVRPFAAEFSVEELHSAYFRGCHSLQVGGDPLARQISADAVEPSLRIVRLWRIFKIKREEKENNLTRQEIREAEKEVQKLEQAADRTISASFKIIAVLAVVVWIFFGVTFLLDMAGINWISTFSSRAKTYWSQPGATDNHLNVPGRNDMLRNMGAGVRK